MPKDTIERAIKRGAGGDDGANYEEVRYEGYGPGGVAIIVEALTDNRNRTACDLRIAFTKHGGKLGETQQRLLHVRAHGRGPLSRQGGQRRADVRGGARGRRRRMSKATPRAMRSTSAPDDFAAVRDAARGEVRRAAGGASSSGGPTDGVPVDGETAETLFKLIEALEDNDDVQTVSANFEVADDVLAQSDGLKAARPCASSASIRACATPAGA